MKSLLSRWRLCRLHPGAVWNQCSTISQLTYLYDSIILNQNCYAYHAMSRHIFSMKLYLILRNTDTIKYDVCTRKVMAEFYQIYFYGLKILDYYKISQAFMYKYINKISNSANIFCVVSCQHHYYLVIVCVAGELPTQKASFLPRPYFLSWSKLDITSQCNLRPEQRYVISPNKQQNADEMYVCK